MKISDTFFDIVLPQKEWQYNKTEGIYNFFNYEKMQGILQISIYVSEKFFFDIDKELEKTKIKYSNASIINMSNYKSIHYGIYLEDNEMLRYDWILGEKNIKIYATLLLNDNQEETVKDNNYAEVLSILNTIKLKV